MSTEYWPARRLPERASSALGQCVKRVSLFTAREYEGPHAQREHIDVKYMLHA